MRNCASVGVSASVDISACVDVSTCGDGVRVGMVCVWGWCACGECVHVGNVCMWMVCMWMVCMWWMYMYGYTCCSAGSFACCLATKLNFEQEIGMIMGVAIGYYGNRQPKSWMTECNYYVHEQSTNHTLI